MKCRQHLPIISLEFGLTLTETLFQSNVIQHSECSRWRFRIRLYPRVLQQMICLALQVQGQDSLYFLAYI